MLSATQLEIGFPRRPLLAPFDFTLPAGECWAVVGRNGSGKSSLLSTLAGLLPARGGQFEIDGRPFARWPRPQLALRLAYLPQREAVVFPYTVGEFVAFGRLPWRRAHAAAAAEDREAIDAALLALDLLPLLHRELTRLSGGEVQRACLAQLLAQSAPNLLLDEPLAHLDLLHQHAVMRLLRGLADQGRAVTLVCHDLALAWRYCHRLLVLGPPGAARLVACSDHDRLADALGWAFQVPFRIGPDGPTLSS